MPEPELPVLPPERIAMVAEYQYCWSLPDYSQHFTQGPGIIIIIVLMIDRSKRKPDMEPPHRLQDAMHQHTGYGPAWIHPGEFTISNAHTLVIIPQ